MNFRLAPEHDRLRAELRAYYADLVTAKGGVRDPRIVDAFRAVERERFVGPGPWAVLTASGYIRTPSDHPAYLYHDGLIALAEERGINNGEPSLHARCLGALNVKPGERIIHVGTGSGYYTAILAQLAGPDGRIDVYELEPDLAERATAALGDRPTVEVHARSGTIPPLPDADVIYVNAGATHPPAVWLDALRPGGRLLFPLTPSQGPGGMLRVTRTEHAQAFDAAIISWAMFIPCIGARDEQQDKRLSTAFSRADFGRVRSLRRGSEPDETAWVAGEGWWLSTAGAC